MTRFAGAFDEVAIEVMAQAVDEVCAQNPAHTGAERELIAKRILGTAALGERDGARMRDDAIAYMAG